MILSFPTVADGFSAKMNVMSIWTGGLEGLVLVEKCFELSL